MSSPEVLSQAPQAGHSGDAEALHQLKTLVHEDSAFARELRATRSTQDAARVARLHGIEVSPEALWRNRGTLVSGGLPTWRG